MRSRPELSQHHKASLLLATALAMGLCLCGIGCRGPQSGGLTVAGSTSVQPVVEHLAERYMENHPDEIVNVQGSGSTAGIRAALSGAAAIGMASRELEPSETGLERFLIARDAIAIIVHPLNPMKKLTTAQLRDIFSRRIRNWQELGGNPGIINFITREEGSGTRGAFEEAVMAQVEIAPDGIVQDSTGTVRAIVAGDPNAIGYISVGMVTPEVSVVSLDGVAPTSEAVIRGDYPLTRPFVLVTRGPATVREKAFIDYLLQPSAQGIIAEEGYIPSTVGPLP